ncbi:hypothetical protein [Candidatus Deianiraea vastatrix]|uniref:Nucleoid-associated protein n=1 Tax=Candidatus Deianiraea vastatrix TaxID=2163644 RepID=A0A5B8XDU8_9RICK|nr:hypothetical protein [Candidatus Deianiraea vastatrix]QED23488.1 hypothetical protein Deia_00697 [Candidatus Deianiraea vastatrix]
MFKQINEARKMAGLIEEKMKASSLEISCGCIKIIGNVKTIEKVELAEGYLDIKHEKLQDDLKKAMNEYMKKSDSGKQKITADAMGGMSGMMDMIKNLK